VPSRNRRVSGNPERGPVSNPISEETFLEKNAQLVYNLALRLTGNPFDAEDLAQDALLRALKALPSFRGESAPATWVYRITVNTWKNRVRSEKRRSFWKTLPLHMFFGGEDEEGGAERSLPADEPPPDAGLEREAAAQAVQNALMTLDEEGRAVIVLRDIEGLSYEEIARSLSLPTGTVKSRISRARDALRARLKDFMEG